MATDAGIHPYPDGDSTISRMAITAREFGFDSVVVIGCNEETEIDGVRVLCAAVLSGNVQEIMGQIRKAKQNNSLIMVNAGDYSFNRTLLHMKGIQVIRRIEQAPKRSFDHIMARIAAERSIAIDINLHPIIHLRGKPRQTVLQRYRDIIALHSRYEFLVTISSNAHSMLDQRSIRDLVKLCSLFDMGDDQVRDALASVGKIVSGRRAVEVVT